MQQAVLKHVIKAIRVYQWIKNILVFLPLFASHQVLNTTKLSATMLAFVAFCLTSSSVYLINDLKDLEADRQHSLKRRRPFAAGDLPLWVGWGGFPLFLAAGLSLSVVVSWHVFASLLTYFFLTLAYSLYLKRLVLVDVLILAVLYGSRIYTGAVAADIKISAWLLIFSIFLFFSLALAKRAGEILHTSRNLSQQQRLPGRSYIRGDLRFVSSIGIASGYMSVLVFALYLNSEMVTMLYSIPQLLWPLCLVLLYWISHIWLKVHRGEMPADPLVYAFRDPVSYLIACLTLGLYLAAWGVEISW